MNRFIFVKTKTNSGPPPLKGVHCSADPLANSLASGFVDSGGGGGQGLVGERGVKERISWCSRAHNAEHPKASAPTLCVFLVVRGGTSEYCISLATSHRSGSMRTWSKNCREKQRICTSRRYRPGAPLARSTVMGRSHHCVEVPDGPTCHCPRIHRALASMRPPGEALERRRHC